MKRKVRDLNKIRLTRVEKRRRTISLQFGLQITAELVIVILLSIGRVGLNPFTPNPHMLSDLFKRYFARFCR